MNKSSKKGLLFVAALGALGFGALTAFGKSKAGDVVTGKSGKAWRVVLIGTTPVTGSDTVHTYELFAPIGSWGNPGELSVLRYSQAGSNPSTRKVVAVASGLPSQMTQTAATDFGLTL